MNHSTLKYSDNNTNFRTDKKLPFNTIETLDLDVTPVMNLFIVLIPLLLSMAVFTQVNVIEFTLPPTANDTSISDSIKQLDISIVVTENGFQIVGIGKKLGMIEKVNNTYQFDKLQLLLKAIKFQYPSQQSVVLIFEAKIYYEDIIHFMDICRESQFVDIGLSGDIG